MIIKYFLRSLVYALCFYANSIELLFFVLVKNLFPKDNRFDVHTKKWARRNISMLKSICGVDYRVVGIENMPKENFLAVSKHQSTWECYFLFYLLPGYPVCVSKKEIMKTPVLGAALKGVGNITVDRKDGIMSMKNILSQSKKFYEQGRKVFLIFPQGTRVPVDSTTDEYPYKPGLIGIAKVNGLDILPICLDSGKFWPKGKFIKKPGTINVKIMPIIKYDDYRNLDKNVFMKKIENIIEENQKLL